jgi:hypothetical protein
MSLMGNHSDRAVTRVGNSNRHPDPATEPTVEGAFAADGVDLTLVRWMLERSPTERLSAAQDLVDAIWALRTGRET